jgi:hypothetical protein
VLSATVQSEVRGFSEGHQYVPRRRCHQGPPRRHGSMLVPQNARYGETSLLHGSAGF